MDLFKELIPSLNLKKEHLLDKNPEEEKSYPAYMVNRTFSQFPDSIMFANEMNFYCQAPNRWQYDFYYYGLPKRERKGKWAKKEDINNIEVVMEYYDYTETKAKQVLYLLTEDQLEHMRQKVYKGD